MLNLVFLKYVTVDEISNILLKFTDATITTYAPANLLFILDSHRNMHRIMDLIAHVRQRHVRQSARASVRAEKRQSVGHAEGLWRTFLKSISLDPKNSR